MREEAETESPDVWLEIPLKKGVDENRKSQMAHTAILQGLTALVT